MTYKSEYVAGLFDLSTWDEDVKGPFGLIPPPGDWEAFKNRIEELKAGCGPNESIKVIYAARHGQAEHNVLGEKYGYDEANKRFPIVDPVLTDLGREQAQTLGKAFEREIARGMPAPQQFFVSPLRRCGETLENEWGWYKGNEGGIPAIVVERLREHLLLHSWNSRFEVSKLKARFPTFSYPADMSEKDEIYQHQVEIGHNETEEDLLARQSIATQDFLRQSKGHTYISVTSHSGALRGVWHALGVPARSLAVGEMNVLVVKLLKEGE